VTGQNGGAAFIFVYLAMTVLVGLPVMIAEHAIGRSARADAIGALRKLAPGKLWWLIGAAGVLSAFLIMAFYTEVAGWVFAYIFKAIGGSIRSTDPAVISKAFGDLISNPWASLLWQWIVLIWVGAIILFGVSKGIERMTKRLMPVLLGILLITIIRSLTLPGAGAGLTYLFGPDFSQITWAAVLTALGLAFFKLSLGMGTMITYGSYYTEDENIPLNAGRVMLADLLVSLLAGITMFPAVFAFGYQPDAGASLLFITIPSVFTSMPLGGLFMVLFFVLAAIAATGAMLSLYEVPVAYLNEQLGWSRRKATLLTGLALVIFGATAALSNSTLSGVTLFGKSFFDLYDFASSNVLLPLGGLFICLFVGWAWAKDELVATLSNRGRLNNQSLVRLFLGLVKIVSPILVLLILLSGLGIIKVG
jgi:NSS family neurotransmitter:Na+ symporter